MQRRQRQANWQQRRDFKGRERRETASMTKAPSWTRWLIFGHPSGTSLLRLCVVPQGGNTGHELIAVSD